MKVNPLIIKQILSNKYSDMHIEKAWGLRERSIYRIRKQYKLQSRSEIRKQIPINNEVTPRPPREYKANPLMINQIKSNKYTDSHIAEAWGICKTIIQKIRKYYGLPPRKEIVQQQSKERQEIVVTHNQTVIKERQDHHKARYDLMLDMWNKDASILDIAKAVDLGVQSAYQRLFILKHKDKKPVTRRHDWINVPKTKEY